MPRLGSQDPFRYLKHKLWPKKRSRIKLPIWFPITKSRKSPQFTCVQVNCYILLEMSLQELQLCFRLHLNQRFAHKIMGLQSCESPNFKNFGTPTWESRDKMRSSIENIIRGKVVASPKSGPRWILWIHVCSWLVHAPKVLQLCTNQLVVWYVQI
jgi:hypothetical protein